jgi:hypothetical protein
MNSLTVEETNLMCVFNTSSRTALINELRETLSDLKENEPEMLETAENVLKKLDAMTDAEFSELALTPDYDDPDDDSEV